MDKQTVEKIRQAAQAAVKAVRKWWDTPGCDGKSPKEKFQEEIMARVQVVTSPEAIKVALSYEEHSSETLTFTDLLAKIKRSFVLKSGMRICVMKTEGDIFTFDVMGCDANNEILFSPTLPWCHFVVANPDPSFLAMFGGKSMLVLK